MQKIRIQKVNPQASLPVYATPGAAGADICACIEAGITVQPGETVFVPSGLAVEIPEGYAGLICARSGLASKRGLAPANKVGVIDSDYRGEIIVALHNHGKTEQLIAPAERIAQLVVTPFLRADFAEVPSLSETERQSGGFGSTGRL